MGFQIERLPPELETLRAELRKPEHRELYYKLKDVPDFHDWLCAIATHVDLLVDGYYTAQDIAGLCTKLTNMLYKKRTGLVVLI